MACYDKPYPWTAIRTAGACLHVLEVEASIDVEMADRCGIFASLKDPSCWMTMLDLVNWRYDSHAALVDLVDSWAIDSRSFPKYCKASPSVGPLALVESSEKS